MSSGTSEAESKGTVPQPYSIRIHDVAKKDWKKLDPGIKNELVDLLEKRAGSTNVPPNPTLGRLDPPLHGCYKIKLRKANYRLIYFLNEKNRSLDVFRVGKRDEDEPYTTAIERVLEVRGF